MLLNVRYHLAHSFDVGGVAVFVGLDFKLLGLGLIGSELLAFLRRSREGECTQPGGANVTTLLIGTFLAFIGISIVLVPAAIWPYAIAGFLILAGIWFLVRGFSTIP